MRALSLQTYPPPLLLLYFPGNRLLGARIAALGEMSVEIILYFKVGGGEGWRVDRGRTASVNPVLVLVDARCCGFGGELPSQAQFALRHISYISLNFMTARDPPGLCTNTSSACQSLSS